MSDEKRIIEINGVKLEVDLRLAKRVDTLRIGDRVKCLAKEYSEFKVFPGVVVGFEPFQQRPTITIAYLDTSYSAQVLKFKSLNADTKDFEIVQDVHDRSLEVNRAEVVRSMNSMIETKRRELEDLIERKKYFEDHFRAYFPSSEEVPNAWDSTSIS